ncbi:hypothetical protein LQV63_03085 [Paenibacillus profundus]|uniref:SagB/ThcOx family dehydrogenase n=1 Tax=Paenibacillus profundus TaxID=1173085 RepID=A0ABS8YD73_9BACL|nr:hypothetical protein [Paenibacillus profundus]MCE5168300.1 hypothetical protein [Paenibacillus profundus]
MNKENNIEMILERNTLERSYHDYIYTHSMPKKAENFIMKFHQASTFLHDSKSENIIFDQNIFPWLKVVEKTDVKPEYYEHEIMLHKQVLSNIKGSARKYNVDFTFTFEELSILLNNSFGRDKDSHSKKYGSAGGLYPVIPLMLVFKSFSKFENGVYVYNSLQQNMMRIKNWTNEESRFVKEEVCHHSTDLPNTCMAYAVDIRKAILKYHIRGYRHAVIEVGAMSQVFKHSLHSLKENVGEISWSGFNDNQLSFECGLNARLCPIILLQWFGHLY